ncbi:MAG: bacillithiol biosynthesis cysteine-adding enzyme BshC [Cyclobacteriaceae bacterium]|nr:bacillithiol biosynthesis cysteine-adding enzyme BshC [Cyclobacteriaceae bacterium]
MKLQKVPFRSTHAFTEFFLKYIEQVPTLQPFYSRYPTVENFRSQIVEKANEFSAEKRNVLVASLQDQYQALKPTGLVEKNIQSLLKENTFTVTTGHQLNIFTGPLYFIYKIVTVINACKRLKEQYPDVHFVPIYWMASEDHDYEEIKSFRLYGKKYTWLTEQKGAVGRFHTKEIEAILKELPGDVSIFRQAYQKSHSLSDAVRSYVHTLFSYEGLIVLDADRPELKKLLQPVMRDDLFQHTAFQQVTTCNDKLTTAGFHPQVNPREINFFYLDHQLRGRIEKQGDRFVVLDSDLTFSSEEITKLIEQSPERFSPNVILRPLYQEIILPNLAYVGGPAELVYWLELKNVFEFFKVPFPILLPRNFALVVDSATNRKMEKTGLTLEEFFEDKNLIFNHWVSKNSNHDLSLKNVMATANELMKSVQERSGGIDPTLQPMAAAEAARMMKGLEKIEKKMLRAEKRLHSDRLRQIEAVKDALFPSGGLQERTDNFLNFYQTDPGFVKKLLTHLEPFDFQFNVLTYHD